MPRDDEPKLNAISRYEKRSPDLALLEYDHCEVPAGCGGVVLRWIDPRAQVPALLRLYAPSRCEAFLDGAAVQASRVTLARGAHVFAFRIERAAPGGAALLFVAHADGPRSLDREDPARAEALKGAFSLRSEPGALWRITATAPEGDAWTKDGFDDRAWVPAAEIALPEPAPTAPERWRYKEVVKRNALPIGLPGAAGPLWIRCRVAVDLDRPEGAR